MENLFYKTTLRIKRTKAGMATCIVVHREQPALGIHSGNFTSNNTVTLTHTQARMHTRTHAVILRDNYNSYIKCTRRHNYSKNAGQQVKSFHLYRGESCQIPDKHLGLRLYNWESKQTRTVGIPVKRVKLTRLVE